MAATSRNMLCYKYHNLAIFIVVFWLKFAPPYSSVQCLRERESLKWFKNICHSNNDARLLPYRKLTSWKLFPAFCCVYNTPKLISMPFIPEPCQTGVKWKLRTVLGVLNFVHTLNTLTRSISLTANWGSNQAKDAHPPVPLLECWL